MSKTAAIRTPVEPEFKAEVKVILKKLGYTVNEAINLFLHDVRDRKELPQREMKRIREWALLHQAELLKNWEKVPRLELFDRINPLP